VKTCVARVGHAPHVTNLLDPFAGLRQRSAPQPQASDDHQEDDHDGAADEFGSDELPADQHGQKAT